MTGEVLTSMQPLEVEARQREATDLFEHHAARLRAAVRGTARTSPVNVEDACACALLQLLRYHPPRECAFSWLCKTAIREAVKLHRRSQRTAPLDDDAQPSDPDAMLDARLDLLAAGQLLTGARLGPRQIRLIALRGPATAAGRWARSPASRRGRSTVSSSARSGSWIRSATDSSS